MLAMIRFHRAGTAQNRKANEAATTMAEVHHFDLHRGGRRIGFRSGYHPPKKEGQDTMAGNQPVGKTAGIYTRVGTLDQHCDMQPADLRRYASRRFGCCQEYVDDGVSGTQRRRSLSWTL